MTDLDVPELADLRGPLAGYIRVSRVGDRDGSSYISPDVQRRAITKWADERGVPIEMHPPEENVSGGTMDRPIFNTIINRIHKGELGGIAVFKLDRFARTLVGGLTTLKDLTDHSALFASATEPRFDFTTADGRLFLKVNLLMSEYFRERATESWESSLDYAVGRGVHIAPGVPYGYTKDKDKILVPNRAAPFVYRAFEMRANERAPFTTIAEFLNQDAPPRADGRAWTGNAVWRMMQRRVYTGLAHWGDITNPDAHPPIVSHELWAAATTRTRGLAPRRQGEDIALLHGLARCAGCRFTVSRFLNDTRGTIRFYYRCRGTRVSGICTNRAALRADSEQGLEAYVERLVCAELDQRARTYRSFQDSTALTDAIAARDAALADLDETRRDTTARRRLGNRWLDFVEPYVEALEQAEAAVTELQGHHQQAVTGLTSHAYLARSRSERAAILAAMIDVIFVRNHGIQRGRRSIPIDDRRVRILWRGQGPTDLPAANKASNVIPWPWPEHEAEAGMVPLKDTRQSP